MKTISREQRARQFMPFASLPGVLRLCPGAGEAPGAAPGAFRRPGGGTVRGALRLSRGDMVRITHYSGDHYEVTEGVLTGFDPVYRRLAIVRREVRFDDIIAAEVVFRQDDIPDM